MKITKSRLEKIIQEEIENVLSEREGGIPRLIKRPFEALKGMVSSVGDAYRSAREAEKQPPPPRKRPVERIDMPSTHITGRRPTQPTQVLDYEDDGSTISVRQPKKRRAKTVRIPASLEDIHAGTGKTQRVPRGSMRPKPKRTQSKKAKKPFVPPKWTSGEELLRRFDSATGYDPKTKTYPSDRLEEENDRDIAENVLKKVGKAMVNPVKAADKALGRDPDSRAKSLARASTNARAFAAQAAAKKAKDQRRRAKNTRSDERAAAIRRADSGPLSAKDQAIRSGEQRRIYKQLALPKDKRSPRFRKYFGNASDRDIARYAGMTMGLSDPADRMDGIPDPYDEPSPAERKRGKLRGDNPFGSSPANTRLDYKSGRVYSARLARERKAAEQAAAKAKRAKEDRELAAMRAMHARGMKESVATPVKTAIATGVPQAAADADARHERDQRDRAEMIRAAQAMTAVNRWTRRHPSKEYARARMDHGLSPHGFEKGMYGTKQDALRKKLRTIARNRGESVHGFEKGMYGSEQDALRKKLRSKAKAKGLEEERTAEKAADRRARKSARAWAERTANKRRAKWRDKLDSHHRRAAAGDKTAIQPEDGVRDPLDPLADEAAPGLPARAGFSPLGSGPDQTLADYRLGRPQHAISRAKDKAAAAAAKQKAEEAARRKRDQELANYRRETEDNLWTGYVNENDFDIRALVEEVYEEVLQEIDVDQSCDKIKDADQRRRCEVARAKRREKHQNEGVYEDN